ncbi:MAG: nucleotidyltransferase family protein [Burkholderiales bacterium]|nr:nucleotidyltransferase family protein [Burkholderiales bacterium]
MTKPPATNELAKLVVRRRDTLLAAMRCITENSREVALVVEAGRLAGVVTDGDIRRGILAGLATTAPVERVMTTRYVSVGPAEGRAAVLELMRSRSIRHVPVLDRRRRLVGIHFLEALLGTAEKPNTAVIMAGGEGRRLRPLTDRVPKPMVEVAGRPILERIVLHLVGHGITRIHVSVNYLAEAIVRHFGDGARFGCRITYLREHAPLGTGGALALLPRRPVHPLLVMNGDLVTQVDVTRLLEFQARQRAAATLAARHHQLDIPFGVVTERRGALVALREKPSHHCLVNAGIYVLEPRVIALVPPRRFYPITRLFETLLARGRRVAVYRIEEDWIDVGRREELSRARGEDG